MNYDLPISKGYIARCLKTLKELGLPTDGWYCSGVIDYGVDDRTCNLCGCKKVRYQHVMDNPSVICPTLEVGCICAGIMEGDILAAEERERTLKNREKRKRYFFKKIRWNIQVNKVSLTYKKHFISIIYSKGQFLASIGGKGQAFNTLIGAKDWLFDQFDPKPEFLLACVKKSN